jgi:hypothetical protein
MFAFPEIRLLFRFNQYRHAVPLSPFNEMEWAPAAPTDNSSELGIVWLRPRQNYPFYLRESLVTFNQKQTITRDVGSGLR